uniref:Odorant receptor, family 92, subfamily A, member 1 n=1 Tax=Denticeps clupeoides TaxID=299321 RepID=A0AAY4AAD9_9TELE
YARQTRQINTVLGIKIAFVFLLSFPFVCINGIMLITLRSKTVFRETSRYILFTHMLCVDSITLVVTVVIYIFAMALLNLAKAVCAVFVLISASCSRNAPLTLALMSLERYVAVCFPFLHCKIATPKTTGLALGFTWLISTVSITVDLISVFALDPTFETSQTVCTRERFFVAKWQVVAFQVFNGFCFVSVTVVLIFTYISIIIIVRTIPTNRDSAIKARQTILLHIIQLAFCLNTFVYSQIEQLLAMTTTSVFVNLRYLNFIFVIVLPRCMSPLIYGLRDETIRHLFLVGLCCINSDKKFRH